MIDTSTEPIGAGGRDTSQSHDKHRRILLLLLEYVVCLLCATGIKTFTETQLIHLHESEVFGEHEIVMSLMREFLYLQQSLEDL